MSFDGLRMVGIVKPLRVLRLSKGTGKERRQAAWTSAIFFTGGPMP